MLDMDSVEFEVTERHQDRDIDGQGSDTGCRVEMELDVSLH